MAEGGAIGGIAGRSNTNFGQQNKIEGAKRTAEKQESKNAANAVAPGKTNTGNRTVTAAPEQTKAKNEGVRTNTKSDIQKQANNLNAANNVADTSQTERGHNINEVV